MTCDFETVQKAENGRIAAHRKNKGERDARKLVGLAISGGGIRSASFGLGVLQALHGSGELRKIDYLSTVSGGGYIGSSLSWFTSCQSKENPPSDRPLAGDEVEERWPFPFGRAGQGVRSTTSGDDERQHPEPHKKIEPGRPLDFIRQHGNYLEPGEGLSFTSLIATALRSIALSVGVYFVLLTFAFFLLIAWKWLPSGCDGTLWSAPSTIATGFAALFAVITVGYGVATFVLPGISRRDYRLRVLTQQGLGFVLSGVALFALLGSLPIVSCQLRAGLLGGSLTGTGMIGGMLEFYRQRQGGAATPNMWSSLRVPATAALLVYGLFLSGYTSAAHLTQYWTVSEAAIRLLLPGIVLGFLVDTNHFGVGRMYRDRLMEAFMPDGTTVATGRWQPAVEADKAKMSEMCSDDGPGPYHLINCNVVLVDSNEAKYRSRGGDSFILSPLFCGSNSIGWYPTPEFLGDSMTLATAMAISGAAANPNAGVAGAGVTRNRLISFIMALLNLRLGYWIKNPAATSIHRLLAKLSRPNLLYPGVVQGLFGQRLNERAGYLELSDGGHFDNTGLYELARRKVDVIIVSDGGADPQATLEDFANAIERVKVDFGYYVDFARKELTVKHLLPGSSKASYYVDSVRLSERGFAAGTINYGNGHIGSIILIKAALVDDLPVELYAYKRLNNEFPNQPTTDQFFDEVQLEAYRELGYQLCKEMLKISGEQGGLMQAFTSASPSTAVA